MRKVLGMLLLTIPMSLFAQSAFNGIWRINDDKWQLDTKPDVYELKDGMFSCLSCVPKVSVKADGTDQKLTGNPEIDTESVKIVDPNTIEVIAKKDGRVTFQAMAKVSSDGKMLERHVDGYTTDGTKSSFSTELARSGEAETGAHAISGSWIPQKTGASDPMTLTFVSTGDGLKFTGSDGEAYNIKFDGKDYPFKGGAGTAVVSVKRIDANTIEESYKAGDGTVLYVSRLSVSPDGKSLTQVGQDKRAGRTNTFVADKQETAEAEK